MSALSRLALLLCYLAVGVTIISLFIPQKRTRKIFGFVIGLFVIGSMFCAVRNTALTIHDGLFDVKEIDVPAVDEEAYRDSVLQKTAENVVAATDEVLRAENIEARDIRIRLKISDEGRIYIDDAVIYIRQEDLSRKSEIENIVYRNLSKEPRVYVEKEEVE